MEAGCLVLVYTMCSVLYAKHCLLFGCSVGTGLGLGRIPIPILLLSRKNSFLQVLCVTDALR